MSGEGAFGGSLIGSVCTFFLGFRRIAEVKFPNMEGDFGGRSGRSPSACRVERVRERVVESGFNLEEDRERDHHVGEGKYGVFIDRREQRRKVPKSPCRGEKDCTEECRKQNGGRYVERGYDMGSTAVPAGGEKSVGQAERDGLRPECLIAINSLRKETETTVVAMCPAGALPYPEKQI